MPLADFPQLWIWPSLVILSWINAALILWYLCHMEDLTQHSFSFANVLWSVYLPVLMNWQSELICFVFFLLLCLFLTLSPHIEVNNFKWLGYTALRKTKKWRFKTTIIDGVVYRSVSTTMVPSRCVALDLPWSLSQWSHSLSCKMQTSVQFSPNPQPCLSELDELQGTAFP